MYALGLNQNIGPESRHFDAEVARGETQNLKTRILLTKQLGTG